MTIHLARILACAVLAFTLAPDFLVRAQNAGLGDHCTATANATVVNGFVVNVEVIDSGCGYSEAPTVLIQGGGGKGAVVEVEVSNGAVSAIHVVDAGFGYTSVPIVIISSPPINPTVSIGVSRVIVKQNVEVGRNYILESSFDLITWRKAGSQFTAESERIETEFLIDVTGRYFRLRDIGLGPLFLPELGINMKLVPAGTFVTGSPSDEADRSTNEGPLTKVTITKSFWLGETEVTQGQWQAVMGYNPSYFEGDPSLPVEQVDWNDAVSFCSKLNELYEDAISFGYRYTLPTEAQWEYACRAGTQTRFHYGDDISYELLNQYAWFKDNARNKTHPVKEKWPNDFGLYDMHGNVYEWCLDGYSNDDCSKSYPGGHVVDPQAPANELYRMSRGGCWYAGAGECRSVDRGYRGLDERRNHLGFRVALSSVSENKP